MSFFKKKNTRQLINCDTILDYGLKTTRGDVIVFFLLHPTNLSVLSAEAVASHIRNLVAVHDATTSVEYLTLNGRESFDSNKRFYQQRAEDETLPVLNRLLELDREQIDHGTSRITAAREFALCVRLNGMREQEVYPYLNQLERNIRERGFDVRRADTEDIKQMLAVYFAQDVVSDVLDNFDGERWSK